MTHLELLNVVLTWRFDQPGWPPVLAVAGYNVDAASVGLQLADRRKIVPEVVATCHERGVTVLVEVKSGRNAEDDQLARMLAITPADLRDLNHLAIGEPGKHQIQLLYVCNADEVARVAAQVANPRVAVVGFDGTRYDTAGSFIDKVLGREIAAAAVSPGTSAPLAAVPFDHESLPNVIARHVLTEVVAALQRGGGVVSVDGLLSRTHHLVFEVMRPTGPSAELTAVRRRVAEVLNDAMHNEFSAWLDRSTKEQAWRFKRNMPHELAGKTRDLQLLRRAADQMLARLGEPASGLQLEIRFDGDGKA